MRKILTSSGNGIRTAVDFFYPPFRKYCTPEFFRYGATGGANIIFDWILYFVFFHYILSKQMLFLGIVTMSSHIAALAFTFPISFLSGFLLQKYVTFTESDLRGKVQLFRYGIVVFINLLINYAGLKLMVDILHFYPTPSKMVITVVATAFSYLSQKKFTFR